MSIFIADTSTQGTGTISSSTFTYPTTTNPNIKMRTNCGIYNSADNTIKIFTNGTDALTIDNTQRVICNGAIQSTGLSVADTNIVSSTLVRKINLVGQGAVMRIFRCNDGNNAPGVELIWKSGIPTSGSDYTYYWDFFIDPLTGSLCIRDRTTEQTRFLINAGGNIGVGKTPVLPYKLDVNGSINSTNLFISGTNISSIYVTNSGLTLALSTKQNTLTASTSLLGNGANITSLNYNNITNPPNLSTYATITQLNTKEGLLNNNTSNIFINSVNTNSITLSSNNLFTYTLTQFNEDYPPKVYNGFTTLQNILLGGISLFRSILTFNTVGIVARVAGDYEIYCSTWRGNGYEPYLAWNFRTTIADGAWESSITNAFSQYNSSTGNYSGANYIRSDYLGEFLIVKLVRPIVIASYQIFIDTNELNKAPKNFRIYGSSDAINWTILQTITNATYSGGVYTNTSFTASSIGYLYYAIVVNAITGSGFTNTKIVEWRINGKQLNIKYLYNCDYVNIDNKPDISLYFTKLETSNVFPTYSASSNIFTTSNVSSNNLYITSNNLINHISYTSNNIIIDTSNNVFITSNNLIYYTSNEIFITSNKLIDYNNLINKPTNLTGDWNTLINKPTNFQADWNSTIINKPTNFQADWNSTIINKPTNFQADWNSTIINKPTIINSQWTTSGTNIYYNTGNVGIGQNPNTYAKLDVVGVVNFHNGSAYAVPNNKMSSGSLTIGGINANYGGGSDWNGNTAGLMLECLDNTEIAFHDSGNRLSSLIYYAGGTNYYHEYGRNMGYGHPNQHYFKCNSLFEVYFNNAIHSGNWDRLRIEPTNLWDGGSQFTTIRNIMAADLHIAQNGSGNAVIRCGARSGTWWDCGQRSDGKFSITKEANTTTNGIFIDTSGQLGINNNSPIGTLCVGNASIGGSDGSIVIGKNNGSGGTRQFKMGYDIDFNVCIGDYGGNNSVAGVVWNDAQFNMNYSTGNVGIGVKNDNTYKLKVNGAIYSSSTITGNGQNLTSLNWNNITLNRPTNFQSDWNSTIINKPTYLSRWTASGSLLYYNSASVGIGGLPNANYWLWVNDTANTVGSFFNTSYFGNTSGFVNNVTASYDRVSFYCVGSALFGRWVANVSDERIKKDIQDIDDDIALQKILQIEPKKYKYKDNIRRGDDVVIGFIAQQIKEVIPEAVKLNQDFIPNIYKVFDLSGDIITTDEDLTSILNVDDYIQIINQENESKESFKVLEISSNHIKIDKTINGDKCFIYGKQVNDFHTLSKEYIFTLNVCATQELSRRIDNLNTIIQQQQTIINNLQTEINEIKSRLD